MRRTLVLTPADRHALERLRDAGPKAYLRERAAALLKVADGASAHAVALTGLLRRRDPDTVSAWLDRYAADGIDGLRIRPGRGRKSPFSPPDPRPGDGDAARSGPPRPAPVRP